MSSRLVALAALSALLAAAPAQAQVATANTAERFAETLATRKLVEPSDRLWLSPDPLRWDAAEVTFLDALTAALVARGFQVMRAPSVVSERPAARPAEPKELGATKILSYTLLRDDERATFRLMDARTGLVQVVEPLSTTQAAAAEFAPRNYLRALGVGGSNLAGSGLTYRRWFENGWGYQVAGVPLVSVEQNTWRTWVNLGAQAMLSIYRTDRVRLFGLAGLGAAYASNPVMDQTGAFTGTTTRLDIGLAPGIGADVFVFNNVALTASLGYTFSRTTVDALAPQWGLNPGGSFGAMIYW